jgi:hypothetical protein
MKPLNRSFAAIFATSLVFALTLTLTLAPTAARAQQSAKRAIAVSQEAPDTVVLGNLPQLTEQEARRSPAISRPLRGVSVQQYAALKAQAATMKLPAPSGAAVVPFIPTPQPKPSTGPAATSITSFGGLGIGCAGEIPPDMALAVGPSFVLQTINSCLTVLDKSGNVQAGFPKSLSAFMEVGASAQVPPFDPRALFDWANQRYIVSAAHVNAAGGQIIDVAVSQSSDPRGGWFVYHINLTAAPPIIPNTQIADFPTLGQDRRMIYVAFNAFTLPDTFNGAYMMLLSKSAMYAGASFNFFALAPSFFTVNGTGEVMDSLQPANVMDRTDNPRAEFVVAAHNIDAPGGPSNTQCATGCSGLVVFAISNPAFSLTSPGPEVSQFLLPTANSYSLPPLATQLGCSTLGCLIDTGDTRVSGEAVYASGSLYAALNTNGTGAGAGASHFLWFQFRPVLDDNNDAACPGGFQCPDITGASMLNEVCWACASGQGDGTGATFYPEVQPDPEGDVLVVFNYSADDTFPSSAYATNRATQALTTMHDSGFFLQNGLATYELLDNGLNRWGDYTAASLDLTPGTQASFWFAAESSKTASAYRTAIGHNEFSRPGQP